MPEFAPVTTIADLDMLDGDEMTDGYLAGYRDAPEPGSDRGRSYWHGWRNGRMDGGHAAKDDAQAQLARAVYVQLNGH